MFKWCSYWMFFELKSRKCYSNHTVTQILTITGKTFLYSSLAELKYKTSVNKTFDYQFIFYFWSLQQHLLITPPSINLTLKQPRGDLSCFLYKHLYKWQLQKPEVSACNLNLPFTPNTNLKFLSQKKLLFIFSWIQGEEKTPVLLWHQPMSCTNI